MNTTNHSTVGRARDIATILLFLVTISAPLLKAVLPGEVADVAAELRRPASMPAIPNDVESVLQFPALTERWWNDAFGFRRAMVRVNNILDWWVFHTSPASESVPVLRGKGDWLFFTADVGIQNFRGLSPLSERQLSAWKEVLEGRREWAEKNGMHYIFAFAPNKQSIYPERMPDSLTKHGPTRYEQLVKYLAAKPDSKLLDLQDYLLKRKQAGRPIGDLYFPLGSHWNDLGAFHAYTMILNKARDWFPRMKPHPVGAFDVYYTRRADRQGDSWASRLYMEDLLIQENITFNVRPNVRKVTKAGRLAGKPGETATECNDETLPTAIMFHDSFGVALRPMLSEHFKRIAYYYSDFNVDLIQQEKPNLIIDLMVERKLVSYRPAYSPLDTDERLEQVFEQSKDVLLSLTPRDPASAISAAEGVEIVSRTEEGQPLVEVRKSGGGLAWTLKPFTVPENRWSCVRLEIDTPVATELRIEFMTQEEPNYSGDLRSNRRALKAGKNIIYSRLLVPDLVGPFRVVLDKSNQCTIRSLEFRAVP